MRRAPFFALFAFFAVAGLLVAQAPSSTTIPIVTNYDYDSATFTFLVLGPSIDATNPNLGNVKTTGSSATTVGAGSATPFSGWTKGYEIAVKPGSGATPLTRGVFAVGSSSSITVDTAWDLSGASTTGYPFSFRRITGGTTDGDGWFGIGGYQHRAIHFNIDQLSVASGSVQVEIDCKAAYPTAKPEPIYPNPGGSTQCESGAFTVAGSTARCTVTIPEDFGFSQCRFGVKLTDDGGDTGANAELVSATFEGIK